MKSPDADVRDCGTKKHVLFPAMFFFSSSLLFKYCYFPHEFELFRKNTTHRTSIWPLLNGIRKVNKDFSPMI